MARISKIIKTILSPLTNYWVRVAILTVAGIWIGGKLDDKDVWIDTRYRIFQALQYFSPRGAHVQRTVLVLIGDNEYWNPSGELQGRVPINRAYLARLVDAASKANAAVIALDFTFSSPNPEGNPVESPQYQPETAKFVDSIWNAASTGKQVVLTSTIGLAHEQLGNQTYKRESDIYGPTLVYWNNVRTGFHILHDDVRNLPLVVQTPEGSSIESFSLAIARADNAASVKTLSNLTARRYAGFLPQDRFEKISADELLSGKRSTELANRVVIISGNWHEYSHSRGPVVSSWSTPVGVIPGALIHANYFEALFDKRFFRVWEGWPMKFTEAILALMVAIPFGLHINRLRYRVLAIAAPYLLIIIITYISLINFGWFFDPLIPVLMVTLHGVVEQIMHWREGALTGARHPVVGGA